MLPSILSDFCLCGSYYHSCSLLKPVYFRCDLLNCITCIFYIFYEIRTLFIHTCIVYFSNNLQRFNQDLFWACTISPFVKTPLKALIWWFLSYILCKTKVKRNLELTVYIKSSLLQHYSIINDNQNVLLCKMLILPLYF